MRRGRAGGLITVGLVVALAAGCTGPAAEPSPSPSPSTVAPEPSPEPTAEVVVAPVRPPEMSQVDEVGAMAAAKYFLELFAYVTGTGDLAEWQAVSAGDCGFCARVHDDVTRVYEADGQYVGGDVTIDGAEVLGYDAVLDGYGVGVTFAFTGGAELDSDGNTVEQKSATVGLAVIDVTHSTGEWILAGLSLRDEQPQ